MEQAVASPNIQQLSDTERAFIEFYTSMATHGSGSESGKDYVEFTQHHEQPHHAQTNAAAQKNQQPARAAMSSDTATTSGAVNQAGGASPGLTVVSPTQATVQRARKETVRRAPAKMRKANTARKVSAKRSAMRRKAATATKKRKSSGSNKKKGKRTMAAKRGRVTGRAVAKSKIQKRRVQKGGASGSNKTKTARGKKSTGNR